MTTQRKNFDRAYKLHAACAISEVRPELAYITFRKGYAYASDGHMAARAKVETIATGFHPDELHRLFGDYEGQNLSMKDIIEKNYGCAGLNLIDQLL